MEQNGAGCQTPQAPTLCVNNCGFFGTPSNMNMCSKCYKDAMLKQDQAKLAASSLESIMNGDSSSSVKPVGITLAAQDGPTETLAVPTQTSSPMLENANGEKPKEGPSRCNSCKKRVGLTGFTCRCGNLFCAAHRYSDKHDCPFNYHKAAQDTIAKANPVVKAEKLDKI
nr:zinc finger A20 and AN1 domain-containing stress-associated protein 8-like [Ipomoea trifida]